MQYPLGASPIWLVSVSHATHISPAALLIKMEILDLQVGDPKAIRYTAAPVSNPVASESRLFIATKTEEQRSAELEGIIDRYGFVASRPHQLDGGYSTCYSLPNQKGKSFIELVFGKDSCTKSLKLHLTYPIDQQIKQAYENAAEEIRLHQNLAE